MNPYKIIAILSIFISIKSALDMDYDGSTFENVIGFIVLCVFGFVICLGFMSGMFFIFETIMKG